MRAASYNIQIVKIKTAYSLETKILTVFKAIVSQMNTPIRIIEFPPPPPRVCKWVF